MYSYLTNISSHFNKKTKVFLLAAVVLFTVFNFSSLIIDPIAKSFIELVALDISTDSEHKELSEVVYEDEFLIHKKAKNTSLNKYLTTERESLFYISHFTPIDSPPPEA